MDMFSGISANAEDEGREIPHHSNELRDQVYAPFDGSHPVEEPYSVEDHPMVLSHFSSNLQPERTGIEENEEDVDEDTKMKSDAGTVAPAQYEDDANENSDPNKESAEAVKFKEDWEAMCVKILQAPESCEYRQNLEVLLNGIERQSEARQKVSKAYEMVENGLSSSLTRVIGSAEPLFMYLREYMETTENELMAHFTESHSLRMQIHKQIEDHNKLWNERYKEFTGRLGAGGPVNGYESAAKLIAPISDPESPNGEEDGTEEEMKELDWDEVVKLDPSSRPKIARFLDSRDRWAAAEDDFMKAVGTIEDNLKHNHENILRIIEEAHDQMYESTSCLQEEIQHRMLENFHRREGLEANLQKAAEKQKSMFARLIASVTSGGAKGKKQERRQGVSKNPMAAMLQRKRKQPDSRIEAGEIDAEHYR